MAEKKVAAAKTTAKKACGTKKAAAKAELVINAENAGFKAGDYVEVECDGDKITLTKTTPPEAKSTKK